MTKHLKRYCCNAQCLGESGYVCEACEAQGICACYDPDSSDVAWEYYKYVYKDEDGTYNEKLKFLSELNSDKIDDKGYHLADNGNRLIAETKNNNIPDFGGDVMFNFNHGKYDIFKEILGSDTDQLNRCAKNHHSLLNFSIMPQTGAMNNFKGINHKLDRFDYFISELDNYYKADCFKRAETALGKYYLKETDCPATVRNNFLNSLSDIKNYCKQVYFIDENFKPNDGILKTNDKNFIKRLIDNGKKAIDTKDNLIKYMDLAEDYWEMRHNQIQKNLCNSCKQGNCNCNSNKYYYTDRHGDSKSYCYHDNCKPEISI